MKKKQEKKDISFAEAFLLFNFAWFLLLNLDCYILPIQHRTIIGESTIHLRIVEFKRSRPRGSLEKFYRETLPLEFFSKGLYCKVFL